jgi:hypothetical protein
MEQVWDPEVCWDIAVGCDIGDLYLSLSDVEDISLVPLWTAIL